ncbi:MAG: molybdopterin cofactor-binding domain-containing protein [Candidatus Sulfotelmatobacter sp.]
MSAHIGAVDLDPSHELALENAQQASTPRLDYRFELQRREFFKLLGGGLLVGMTVSALAQESGGGARRESEEDLPNALSAWLHIAEDGKVTVYTGKVEIGQNIRTSLSQQVAEELRAPMESIHLVMADTALTPFDMGTFGSRTTPNMGPRLRTVAATAREALVALAADRWHVSRDVLVAAEGKITDSKSKKSISYGELSRGQELVTVIPDDPPLLPPKDWRIAGTPAPKVDGRAFVTGEHKYTPDMALPGMLVGKVVRPTAFKASLTSLDAAEAGKMPGVTVVHDGNFVAVAAPDEPSAARAAQAIRAQWSAPPQSSDATLFADLRKPTSEPGETYGQAPDHVAGSLEQGLAAADKTLAQTYTVAYIAHAPLEPRAALAEWSDGKLTVWTGTQRPFAVRDDLAQAFRLPIASVRVIVPDTGSAYGGKHTGDAAIEAARLAKAAGKPVRVTWTREEEFTWAYFRPAGVIDVKSGVRKDGTVVAWQFDNYNSGPSAIRTPYNIANQKIEFHASDSPLRQGSYRGLAATANHFARETHMDELAHLVGMDPLEFRLKNLNDPRLIAVFHAAAEKFGWGREKSSATRGFGIAGGVEKGGYIATCAEVEIDRGRDVAVKRLVACFECGAVVNPDGLRNQVMGAALQGLGGGLFEAVKFENGRITNPHFAEYRVPRFADAPQIEVVLVDRKDQPPAGAGETPIVGTAPAVGNAIFAATGIRLRSMPLIPDGLPKPS